MAGGMPGLSEGRRDPDDPQVSDSGYGDVMTSFMKMENSRGGGADSRGERWSCSLGTAELAMPGAGRWRDLAPCCCSESEFSASRQEPRAPGMGQTTRE